MASDGGSEKPSVDPLIEFLRHEDDCSREAALKNLRDQGKTAVFLSEDSRFVVEISPDGTQTETPVAEALEEAQRVLGRFGVPQDDPIVEEPDPEASEESDPEMSFG